MNWFYSNCSFDVGYCLQCFDAVGWAAGRDLACKKLSGGVLAWLSVWSLEWGADLHIAQLMPLPLLLQLNLCRSGKGPLKVCVCVRVRVCVNMHSVARWPHLKDQTGRWDADCIEQERAWAVGGVPLSRSPELTRRSVGIIAPQQSHSRGQKWFRCILYSKNRPWCIEFFLNVAKCCVTEQFGDDTILAGDRWTDTRRQHVPC